jgi:hypothetical protein
MERIVEITPAFDKRNKDPNKNYGIHGCELKMLVKGEKGAIQFVIYTNWMLPHVQKEFEGKDSLFFLPMPADVGYHAVSPQYEGQTTLTESCPYLDGKPCYYDGSGLRADKWFDVLVHKGSDEVWKMLEDEYRERFE